MSDDERMEEVLRAAMSSPAPTMSPAFEQDLMRRTAPRRLSPVARVGVGAYALLCATFCAWVLQDVPVSVAVGAIAVQVVAAVALRSYVDSLVTS